MQKICVISEDSSVVIKLIEIWKEVLHVDNVSIYENFLDLGGDSLSAMLCISRIRSAFEVEFDIMDFFLVECTIAELAKSLLEQNPEKGEADTILHFRRLK
jgi:surfactin family lipopeptide synthetase C